MGWADGKDDDAAPFNVETEEKGECGVSCYLGNSDDVMGKVETGSDWLTGCGASLPEG